MSLSQVTDYTGQKFNSLTAIKFIGYKETGKLKAKRRVWLFECDCGNHKELAVENVARSKSPTKSCGCIQYYGAEALQYACFAEGGYNDGDLTFEQFLKLSQEDCDYCGLPAKESNTRYGRYNKEMTFSFNGLDRVDNNRKHDYDNVVPCCKPCNTWKSNKTKEQFFNRISKIYERCIRGAMK